MQVRRIKDIADVIMMYDGIRDGIRLGSFTDKTMFETLNLITDRETTYYIFEDGDKIVGFGGIKDKIEIFKVYVMPQFRGHGYGRKISLFLTNKIFRGGQVPVCWIKKMNTWNNAMEKMGMMHGEKESSFDVNYYRLMDLKTYIKALEKYGIEDIVEPASARRVVPCIIEPTQHRHFWSGFGGC